MKYSAAAILGFAIIATCCSFPLNIDNGSGLDLTPGDTTFWNSDFVIGEQQVQVGLGWNKQNNALAAGVKVLAGDAGGKKIPISAGLSGNINDMKSINYVIGTKVEDTVSLVLKGDVNKNINYQLNAKVPVKSGGVTSVGASLEGSGQITDMKTLSNTLTAGVGVGQEAIQASVSFVGIEPSSLNVQVVGNPK